MTRLEKIEQDIRSLDPAELARLRDWFAEYDAVVWDAQMERDAASGKLDTLARHARASHAAGRTRPL